MVKIKLSILFIFSLLLSSCDLDQKENRYIDYEKATEAYFWIKGWIPKILIKKSMTDIYVRNNLDLNTCIFSYKLAPSDIDSLQSYLLETDTEFKKPRRIKAPEWWIRNAQAIEKRYYIMDNIDSVFIAIDFQNSKIYGWRNTITSSTCF